MDSNGSCLMLLYHYSCHILFHLVILQSSLYRITLSDVLDLHNIYIGGIHFIVLNEHKINGMCRFVCSPGEEKLRGAASEGGGGEDGAELAP